MRYCRDHSRVHRRIPQRYRIESLERRTLLSSWINPAGGSFTDPANWDTGLAPGPSDDVTINLSGTYTISLGSTVAIHSLALGAGSGVQTLSIASGELDLAAASSIASTGALVMSGSTLNQAGGFSAAGSATLTSSTISGTGQFTNAAGASLTLQDAAIASPLVNQGILLSRGDADSLSAGLTTAAGSVLRVQGNSAYEAASLNVANGFVSNGLIDLTSADGAFDSSLTIGSGSLTTSSASMIVASPGAGGVRHLEAQLQLAGALSVQAPMTLDKASAVSTASGIITLGSGDLTINQSGLNPSFTTSGGVNIAFGRTLTVTGAPLTIAGGVVSGSGTLNGAVNNIAGAVAPSLAGTGRTLYYEPFNYAAGSQLDGQGGWSEPGLNDPYSDDYNTPEIVQDAPGSSTGSLASSTLLTSGHALRTNGQYSFDDVVFGNEIGGDGGTYWFSVLMRQETAGNGGKIDPDYGQLVLGEGDNTVSIGKPGAGPGINNWSLETPDSATQSASNVPVTIGTSVLLVASVQFEPGPDHVTLYVNPPPGADPSSLVPAATLDVELNTFDLIAINTGVNATWTFDEIRIGTSYGDVTPRATGAMTIQGNYTASASSSFGVDLFGASPGSLYDQLNVNGAVTLAGALNINAQFIPASTQVFTILNNDGADPINGTFSGLPESTVTFAAGKAYRISYIGGDGNDVTLTYLPGLSVNDISVIEGTGGTTTATFTVSLSDAGNVATTVQWATQDGTATAPADYTAASGTLTFGPNVRTQTVSITINPDALDEPDETFSLVLSNPTNAIISDATGICTILDDDPPPVTASFVSPGAGPRTAALSSITLGFSEAVSGFDLADLQLMRDGASVSLDGVTLSSADNITWTVGNLDAATARAGSYALNLPFTGSGIQSIATGAPLLRDASVDWKMAAVLGTTASDVITLARESSPGLYDVWVNNNSATPDYSVDLAMLGAPLQVLGLDGRDMLRILAQPGDTFSVSSGQITRDGTSEMITYASPVEALDVENATFNITADLADPGGFDLAGNGAGTRMNLLASQHLDALQVGAQTLIQFQAGAGLVAVINQLTIDGRLDLTDNDLILPGAALGNWNTSAYDGVSGMIKSGAIFSSLTQSGYTTLGVADAGSLFSLAPGQTAGFDGQSVSPGDVLVKFTYIGDANLDGKVNIDDYGRIDGNIGQSGSVFGWYNGDFNLDGKINIDDYGLIDSIIGIQGPPL